MHNAAFVTTNRFTGESVSVREVSVVNLTPHAINLHRQDGSITVFEPSGKVARVDARRFQRGALCGAPVYQVEYGQITDLPDPTSINTIYIVSRIVREAARDRGDLVVPDDLVRDANGAVIGCRAFSV